MDEKKVVAVKVRDINLSFGGVQALTNVSFDVRKGEIDDCTELQQRQGKHAKSTSTGFTVPMKTVRLSTRIEN